MKKYAKIIYLVSIIAVLLLLTIFCFHEKADEFVMSDKEEYRVLEDYEYVSYDDSASPTGITQEYRWTLTDIPKRNGVVASYIVHQGIEIYVDDELVYSLNPGEDNSFSKGVGCKLVRAYLYPEDEGKEIRILVHPLYKTSIQNKLTIYLGNYDALKRDVIIRDIPIIIIGIACLIIGLILTAFYIINCKKPEINSGIIHMGIFAIFTGLWKLTDIWTSTLIINNSLLLSAISLMSLPVMVLSYIFFLRNQFEETRHKLWNITGIACGIITLLIIILQFTGIADLKQSLVISHCMVAFVCIFSLFLIIRELHHKVSSRKIKLTFICCILCLTGSFLDICMYYYTHHSSNAILGMLAFLFYIVSMGFISLRETLYLVKRGKDAKRYEQLALHDELTGLYSRVFFSQYVEKQKSRKDKCYVIMFDINNLKQCNDTRGHAYGDMLLCDSAHLIERAFLPDGRCVRLGGDEFCVLLRYSNEEEIKNYLSEFDQLINSFNRSHPDRFNVQIAYGYSCYDEDKDSDLNDTLRRADKKMYNMKHNMKKAATA